MRRFLIGMVFLISGFYKGVVAAPLFSEFMPDPTAVPDRDGEWFELYNPDPMGYDLFGWTILDWDHDRFTITVPLFLAPGETVLFARSGVPLRNGGLFPDYVYGNSLTLANGSDELVLQDPGGGTVDEVVYHGGFPFGAGVAAALIDPEQDNTAATAWRAAISAYNGADRGTPGSVPAAWNVTTPVPSPSPLWLLLPATALLLARRGRDCGLIPHHDPSAAPVHRPALHPRQAPQSLHFLHHPHLDAGHRRGCDRAHHRALGDERL